MESLYSESPVLPIQALPQSNPRKRLYVGLGITVGLLLLAGLIAAAVSGGKLLFAAFQEPSKAMTGYTDALIRKDYQSAYSSASPELRVATSFTDLVKYHDKLLDRFGALKSVQQTYWHIETKNGVTASTIQADFKFERGNQSFEFELHAEKGTWRVFSYKQLPAAGVQDN